MMRALEARLVYLGKDSVLLSKAEDLALPANFILTLIPVNSCKAAKRLTSFQVLKTSKTSGITQGP